MYRLAPVYAEKATKKKWPCLAVFTSIEFYQPVQLVESLYNIRTYYMQALEKLKKRTAIFPNEDSLSYGSFSGRGKESGMKNDEMVLRFCEDKSIRLEFFENGQKRTKVISVETLTDCISRSLAGVRLTTGLLPANALSVTMDSDNERRYAVLEFPDERATVTYMNTEYPDFPLPRLLFGFRIEDSGRISGINIGVPDLGKLRPTPGCLFILFPT